MLTRTLLAGFGLFTASASAQSLLSVLVSNGHTEFARVLQEQGAVIESVPGARLIVYAPPNAAIARHGAIVQRLNRENETSENDTGENDTSENDTNENDTGENDTSESKTRESETKEGEYYYTMDTAPELRRTRRRQTDLSAGPCPVWAYETLLSHPALVNLGPGRNQTVVQKDVGAAAVGVVFTGLGASVKITSKDIPFNGGVVRPIAETFTLPHNLSATLPFLNAGRFKDALQRTGLLATLDGQAEITVLAPTDDVFPKNISSLPDSQLVEILKRQILVSVTAYTPLLRDGAVFSTLGGTSVTVSMRGNEFYIGGALIVSGDAILTNGVVHTVDRLLPGSVTTPPPPVVTGAAAALKPMNLYALALPAMIAVAGRWAL